MTTTRAPRTTARTSARAGGVVLAAGFLTAFGLVASPAEAKPEPKVTICHATASVDNPYIKLSVRPSSLDGKGNNDHTSHGGGLFDFSDPAANASWGDIIPAGDGVAYSLNATVDGLGIFANGCNGPHEGSCPDGSAPVGGQCPTQEVCPGGGALVDGDCPDELEGTDGGTDDGGTDDGGTDDGGTTGGVVSTDDGGTDGGTDDGGTDDGTTDGGTTDGQEQVSATTGGTDGGTDGATTGDIDGEPTDVTDGTDGQTDSVDGSTDDETPVDEVDDVDTSYTSVVRSPDDEVTDPDAGTQVQGEVIWGSTSSSSLPVTGADISLSVVAGAGLVALGSALLLAKRRTAER